MVYRGNCSSLLGQSTNRQQNNAYIIIILSELVKKVMEARELDEYTTMAIKEEEKDVTDVVD